MLPEAPGEDVPLAGEDGGEVGEEGGGGGQGHQAAEQPEHRPDLHSTAPLLLRLLLQSNFESDYG